MARFEKNANFGGGGGGGGKFRFVSIETLRPVFAQILAYGLRNPSRMSWDTERGELWSGDVGENRFEEINVITAGMDYGWNVMEGNSCYFPNSNCQSELGNNYMPPVAVLPHPSSCSDPSNCNPANAAIGGYWYRGSVGDLRGKYIFADFTQGFLYAMQLRDRAQPKLGSRITRLVPNFSVPFRGNLSPVAFAEDHSGELYVIDWGRSRVWKFVSSSPRLSSAVALMDDQELERWRVENANIDEVSEDDEFFDSL